MNDTAGTNTRDLDAIRARLEAYEKLRSAKREAMSDRSATQWEHRYLDDELHGAEIQLGRDAAEMFAVLLNDNQRLRDVLAAIAETLERSDCGACQAMARVARAEGE